MGVSKPVIQFGDRLVNGAGFTRRLFEKDSGSPLLLELLQQVVSKSDQYPRDVFFAPGHGDSCDQACYRCLMRYGNQPYHGLLDWRLGLSFLEALLLPDYRCGLDGKFDAPETASLNGWPSLAKESAQLMARRFAGTAIEELDVGASDSLWAFRLSKGPWSLVVHPLWDPKQLSGILDKAYELLGERLDERGESARIEVSNTFDIGRRPVWVYERLMKTEGQ